MHFCIIAADAGMASAAELFVFLGLKDVMLFTVTAPLIVMEIIQAAARTSSV